MSLFDVFVTTKKRGRVPKLVQDPDTEPLTRRKSQKTPKARGRPPSDGTIFYTVASHKDVQKCKGDRLWRVKTSTKESRRDLFQTFASEAAAINFANALINPPPPPPPPTRMRRKDARVGRKRKRCSSKKVKPKHEQEIYDVEDDIFLDFEELLGELSTPSLDCEETLGSGDDASKCPRNMSPLTLPAPIVERDTLETTISVGVTPSFLPSIIENQLVRLKPLTKFAPPKHLEASFVIGRQSFGGPFSERINFRFDQPRTLTRKTLVRRGRKPRPHFPAIPLPLKTEEELPLQATSSLDVVDV